MTKRAALPNTSAVCGRSTFHSEQRCTEQLCRQARQKQSAYFHLYHQAHGLFVVVAAVVIVVIVVVVVGMYEVLHYPTTSLSDYVAWSVDLPLSEQGMRGFDIQCPGRQTL